MRLHFILLIALVSLLTSTAAAQESATHELVGFSTTSVVGFAGVGGMNAECASDFGSDARMCNSVEVMRTASPPLGTNAWVRPVFSPTGVAGLALDASGAQASSGHDLSCAGWSGGIDFMGLLVTNNQSFVTFPCNLDFQVACCEPIPPPTMAHVPALLPLGRGILVGMLMLAAGMAFLARRVVLLQNGPPRPRLRG